MVIGISESYLNTKKEVYLKYDKIKSKDNACNINNAFN